MIKELTPTEATLLRERVKKRFLSSPFNGAGFRVTQYKKSYQPLADDIIQAVGEMAPSVTANRLRKFFYYTDPAVCVANKLEKASFGDDFIRALILYVESKAVPAFRSPNAPKKWLWRGTAGLLVFVLGLAGICQWMNQPVYWKETFDDVRPVSLRSRGFDMLYYDAEAFCRQPRPGCLALYTYPGDFWVKWEAGESPYIKNLVYKRLGSERCVVTSVITGSFSPRQNWQQAGIFLFGSTPDAANCLRMTFVYDSFPGNGFHSNGMITHAVQKYSTLRMQDSVPYEYPPVYMNFPQLSNETIQRIGFSIRIDHRKVLISYLAGPTGIVFQEYPTREIELPFQPVYVGIAAFQGLTGSSGERLHADTIPAYFDYLKTEPLKQ